MTVGWLITKALDTLHINELMSNFAASVPKVLHVKDAKDDINKLVSEVLESINVPLRNVAQATGAASISTTAYAVCSLRHSSNLKLR